MFKDNQGGASSKLLEVLAKPTRPHCAVTEASEWAAIEDKFSLHFPADYRAYIGTYGTGTVGDFISIFNPFSTDKYSNFFYNKDFVLGGTRYDTGFLLPLFPQEKGVLPFAKTYDGDNLWWQTQGEPDNWSIVVTAVRSSYYETYPMNLTDFLIKLIVRNRESKKDLLRNSEILKTSFERKAPFISLWSQLQKRLQHLKNSLIRERDKGNNALDEVALNYILLRHGLELETDLVQQQLEDWHQNSFIQLLKDKEIYLQLLEPKT